MSIESEIFLRLRPDKAKLRAYGFKSKGSKDFYSINFLDGKFRAEISVMPNGEVKGKVIDLDTDYEYMPLRSESGVGEFVGKVREAYKSLLCDIADKCFIKYDFIYEQANRIAAKIYEKYKETPDFPWSKLEGAGVFRFPKNKKWYGLIMNVPMKSLDKTIKDETEANKIVEIMNIKIVPEKLDELLKINGIRRCYHMNKKQWVTLMLDETLSDDFVMELIDQSRNLILPGSPKSVAGTINTWIAPANPKFFDIELVFAKGDVQFWKQGKNMHVGDIVYLYVGSPVSAVRYKCSIIELDIPYEHNDPNVNIKYLMKIKILHRFNAKICTFAKLNQLGIYAVRGPRSAPQNLIDYLEKNK